MGVFGVRSTAVVIAERVVTRTQVSNSMGVRLFRKQACWTRSTLSKW